MGALTDLSTHRPPLTLDAAEPRKSGRPFLLATFLILMLALAAGAAVLHGFVNARTPPLPPPTIDVRAVLSDLRTVDITTTTPTWKKVSEVATIDQLHTDHELWRRMHFGDWDRIPQELRESALRAMIRAYTPLFRQPGAWQRMSLADWDRVPQPIRSMAFLRMIWYWARAERVGVPFGLRPDRMAQNIGAIVMAESWFEHMAVNENEWGNRDLGLAQCSDHCRAVIAEMAAAGTIRYEPSDSDYFNPWLGTWVATIWFNRELENAEGDVELAIRAYHRGIDAAMDEKGDGYLARVLQLRERYIRALGPSPSWQFLSERIAEL